MSSKMYPLFKPSYQTLCISLLSHVCHMHCLPHPMSHPADVSLIQKETTEYKDVTVNDKKAHGEWRYSSTHSYRQHRKVSGQSRTLANLPLKKEHPSSARTHSIATLNGRQCYPRSFLKNLELNYNSLVIQPTAKSLHWAMEHIKSSSNTSKTWNSSMWVLFMTHVFCNVTVCCCSAFPNVSKDHSDLWLPDPDYDATILQNIRNHSPKNTPSQPKRPETSATLL